MIRFQVSVHCTHAQDSLTTACHPSSDKSTFLYSPPILFLLSSLSSSPSFSPLPSLPFHFSFLSSSSGRTRGVHCCSVVQGSYQCFKPSGTAQGLPEGDTDTEGRRGAILCVLCKYGRWLSCSFFSSLHSFSPPFLHLFLSSPSPLSSLHPLSSLLPLSSLHPLSSPPPQSPSHSWQKVEYLLEFGEWLYCHQFPIQDALDQFQEAMHILSTTASGGGQE